MADRSVVLRLRAEVGGYRAAMAQATQATDAFGDKANKASVQASTGLGQVVESATKHEQAWQTVGTTLLGVGAAATAGVGAAIAKYSEFDAAMSAVQAATHETAGNMDLLRDAAMKAGADTQFSATEAAGAVEELSKAGVSTADIIGGGLAGALDLAAAGGIDVASAAETAATALTQFKLGGEDVSHVADLLAAGAGKAQGGVRELGQALGQSGLVASQFGLSVEDTVGTLSAFASAGLIGSDAGTSFKTMLLSLAKPAKETQETMAELGISAYDAQGNFVGITDLAGQLQTKLGGLTQAQRDAALAQIFGTDAIRAANVLFEQGASGIQGWIDKTNDAGYAAETAAARTDNLRGDLERLGGAFDTALINLGAGSDGALRTVVQTVEAAVDSFGALPASVQNSTLVLGGIVGVAGLAGGAFLTLAPRILETRRAVNQLSTDMPRLSSAMRGLGEAAKIAGALGAVAVTVSQVGDALSDDGAALQANALADAVDRLGKGDLSALDEQFRNFEDYLGSEDVNDLASAFERLYNPTGAQAFTDQLDAIAQGLPLIGSALGKGELSRVQERFVAIDQTLADLVSGGNIEGARAGFEQLAAAAEQEGVKLDQVTAATPLYQDAVLGAARAAEEAAQAAGGAATATGDMALAIGEVPAAAESTYSSLESYAAALGYDEEQTDALRDSTEELGESMLGFVDPLGTYTSYLDAKIAKEQEASGQTAATGAAGQEAWRQFVNGAGIAFDQYLADLEQQVRDQANWQTNMLRLAGRVSQGTIDELARMGPEGAPLVAELVNRSDAELDRFDTVAQARSKEATDAWGAQLTLAIPVLAKIAETAGADTVAALAAELQAGKRTVADIAAEYGVELAGGVNPVLEALGKRPIAGKGRQGGLLEADGGVVDYYATGGLRENHVAQIAPAGAWRVWAEDETGGESYIPLHPSKRQRSLDIWRETGRRLGVKAGTGEVEGEAYAQGGIREAEHFANGGYWRPEDVRRPPSSAPFREPISTTTDAVTARAYDDVRAWVEANSNVITGPDGEPIVIPPGGGKDLVSIGRLLQSMGARVSEHPAFGGVRGRHSPTSLHYKGRAIDVNYGGGGANAAENSFMRSVIPELRKMASFRQLYFREIGGRTDHDDHLHLGLADGGVLDSAPKGSRWNPHLRDQGGPLLPGHSYYNGTGAPEMVIPVQPGGGVLAAAQAPTPSGPMELVGTLDLGNGLTGVVRGVVRSEVGQMAREATTTLRGRGHR